MKLWDAIMIGTVALGAVLLASSQMVFGQDRIEVPLPDITQLSETDARNLARSIGEANVITSSCHDYQISGGEWTLLAGTADLLADQLGMDPAEYDQAFNAPAYALLDDPAACDRIGPQATLLIARLVAMGGGTGPDQPDTGPDQQGTEHSQPDDAPVKDKSAE